MGAGFGCTWKEDFLPSLKRELKAEILVTWFLCRCLLLIIISMIYHFFCFFVLFCFVFLSKIVSQTFFSFSITCNSVLWSLGTFYLSSLVICCSFLSFLVIYCNVVETSWNKAKNKEDLTLNLEGISTVLANWYPLVNRMFSSCPLFSSTQRPNVSKHVLSALIVFFFCLEACLVEAALIATLYLFGCRRQTF